MLGMENLPPELQRFFIVFLGTLVYSVVISVFFFLMIFFTRGVVFPFFKAKLRGKSILVLLTKDKKMKFIPVKSEAGMYKADNGYFLTNPETVYITPNTLPASIGYETLGSTLNPKHVLFLQKLKEGMVVKVPKMKKVKEKGKTKYVLEKDEKGNTVFEEKFVQAENIEDLMKLNDIFKKLGMDLVLNYNGETLRVQDINNFFLYNNNPSLIETKIENRIAKELEGQRKIPLHLIMVMVPLIIVVVIAFMIVSNYLNAQGLQDKLLECTSQLANLQASQRVVAPVMENATGAPTIIK